MQTHQSSSSSKAMKPQKHTESFNQTSEKSKLVSNSLQQNGALADTSLPLSQSHILQMQRTIGNRATIQLMKSQVQAAQPIQRAKLPEEQPTTKENKTGMPDALKSGLENQSGMDLSDVRVHYNSAKPAQLQALAYAQGNEIHIGPGQEQHLPHEGWHVVQQRQGRVKPTVQMKQGIAINDDFALEKEADVMGRLSAQATTNHRQAQPVQLQLGSAVVQRAVNLDIEDTPNDDAVVHIKSIDRPSTPDTAKIIGMNADDPAARHIIPQALLERNFKARFSGYTVEDLVEYFPSVDRDTDYLHNLSSAMQKLYTYENKQLNRGGGVGGEQPEGRVADDERDTLLTPENDSREIAVEPSDDKSGKYRNFWEGDQTENLNKDVLSSEKLKKVENKIHQKLGVGTVMNSAWVKYQTTYANRIIDALAEEFDPPPFASKQVIESAAREWARLTNEWIRGDKTSQFYYDIQRPFTWEDAVRFGANLATYTAADDLEEDSESDYSDDDSMDMSDD